MESKWYDHSHNSSGWYAPTAEMRVETDPTPPPRRVHRGRRVALAFLAVLVLIAASCLAFGGREDPQGVLFPWSFFWDGDDGESSPDRPFSFDDPDVFDDDFRDFFDSYYTATESSQECTIPPVDHYEAVSLTLSAPGEEELTLHAIYEKCVPSIVAIRAYTDEQISDSYYWGTGIILTEDGYIVTNSHIIEGTCRASIALWDDREYEAQLVGYDPRSDIAVLKIDAQGLTPAEFCTSEGLLVGDSVVAIGNPLGEQFRSTMTEGIISGIDRDVSYNGTTLTLIQTSAPLNEGNSGGALFNRSGQVIGITNMKMSSNYYGSASIEGVGFAIPSQTVKAMADALLAQGQVSGRPALGITVGAIPQAAAGHYQLPSGLYVSEVVPGSGCDQAGIQAGDILTHVNGEPVTETQDVTVQIQDMQVGDTLELTIWRDGETWTVTVALVDVNDVY